MWLNSGGCDVDSTYFKQMVLSPSLQSIHSPNKNKLVWRKQILQMLSLRNNNEVEDYKKFENSTEFKVYYVWRAVLDNILINVADMLCSVITYLKRNGHWTMSYPSWHLSYSSVESLFILSELRLLGYWTCFTDVVTIQPYVMNLIIHLPNFHQTVSNILYTDTFLLDPLSEGPM